MCINILLSVIIPFYKGEKYIFKAISSVLKQPYKNIEILLINDGSPSGKEICEKIAESDERVHLYTKKNEGIGATRNFGITKAKGTYLAFLDQDDVWTKDFLSDSIVEKIYGGGDIIGFSFYNCNSDFSKGNLIEVQDVVIEGGVHAAQTCKNHHSSMFYSATLLENPDIRYALSRQEDVIFLQRALYQAKKITFINKVMFLYRNNKASETHRNQSVEALYGSILNSWILLEAWHESKHYEDREAIGYVKHMICVYTMEAVEKIYQSNLSDMEAEQIITKSLPRNYLDNFESIVLSENRRKQIGQYQNNRKEFILNQKKIKLKNSCLKILNSFPFLASIYDNKRYKTDLKSSDYLY